jgi:hypothetical protein
MSKLPEPFPSAPKRSATHELKFEKKGGIVAVHLFGAAYAAKHFLEAVMKKDKFKWLKRDRIELSELALEIVSPELEDLIEHKFTPQERDWELPDPFPMHALHLRGEKPAPKKAPAEDDRSDKAVPERPKGKRPPPVRKELPKGMIALSTICEELKVEPREARAFLRKEHDKPEAGWAWNKKGAADIKADLKREFKK